MENTELEVKEKRYYPPINNIKRNKGITKWNREQLDKVIRLIENGTKESKTIKNYKPYTPMTLAQAAKEMDRTPQAILISLRKYPEFAERYELAKETRREVKKSIAENVLDQALEQKMDIDDKDVARLALDFLKATDKAYNPKIEIEQNIKKLSLNISDEEMMARFQSLIS